MTLTIALWVWVVGATATFITLAIAIRYSSDPEATNPVMDAIVAVAMVVVWPVVAPCVLLVVLGRARQREHKKNTESEKVKT